MNEEKKNLTENALDDNQLEQVSGGRRRPRGLFKPHQEETATSKLKMSENALDDDLLEQVSGGVNWNQVARCPGD